MRRGCISSGDVQCHQCHRLIPNSERYLAIGEERGKEADTGQTFLYCVECALKKGYAAYRQEKGEKILTVFPGA